MRAGFGFRDRESNTTEKGGEVVVELKQPFSLEQSAECGQAFRWVREGEIYSCVVGERVLKVKQRGKRLFASLYPDNGYFSTLSAVGDVFRFDDDVKSIMSELSSDQLLRKAMAGHEGLRLIRQDPWECLISYLCSINSNIPRIKGNVESLSRRFGNVVSADGRDYYTFPTVDALAGAEESELRAMKLGYRAKYIVSAARKVKDERIDLMGFRRKGYDESFEELCSFYGIGPKVADCILLFSMDKLQAFPVDRWVRRGVEILYFKGEKMSEKKIREWAAAHFGRYAGYAQEYLFYGSRLREIVGATTRNAAASAGTSGSRAGSREN